MSRREIIRLIPTLTLNLKRTQLLQFQTHNLGILQRITHKIFTTFQYAQRPLTSYAKHNNYMQISCRQHRRAMSPLSSSFRAKNDKISPLNAQFSVSSAVSGESAIDYLESSDPETRNILSTDMKVLRNFISEEEEQQLFKEVEPYLRRLRYETSHWDDAIHGYRETERKIWSEKNKEIVQRVRDTAFPPGTPQLAHVHVLDLKSDGYIKPHIDAVKFCGNTIAGISLLSSAVMRLVHKDDQTKFADFFLERRSLYIMKDAARYNYTHEILPDGSVFKGKTVQKDRRISVMCRNEP